MIAPVIIAAAITAAASAASARQQSSAANSATSQGRAFSIDFDKETRARYVADREWDRVTNEKLRDQDRTWNAIREDNQLQRLTADASAAGLHPAFAMGGPGYTPTATQQFSTAQQRPDPYPGQSASGSGAGRGIEQMGSALASGIMGAEKQKQIGIQNTRSTELHDLEIKQREQSLNRGDLEFLSRMNEIKRAEHAALASPTMMGQMLKPAEPEAKSHPIVNLPLLGRVRLNKSRMTGGGATEQVGEGADWLYGIDLLRRALIQKIQRSSYMTGVTKRKMQRKWPAKVKRKQIDYYDFAGGS